MFSDVHCHLDHPDFKKDLKDVIAKAKKSNVTLIITSGTDQKKNETTLRLAKEFNIVKPSLGLYPTAVKLEQSEIQKQLGFIEKNKDKIVGVGEVGMDRPMDSNDVAVQKELFIQVIALAKKIKKPLIIHSRGAEKHVLSALEQENVEFALLHSYNGPVKYARKAIDMGLFFSIPQRIISDEGFQQIEEIIPDKQVLTETDSPFLAREKNDRNDPSKVVDTVGFMSRRRGKNMEKVIEGNLKRFLSAP